MPSFQARLRQCGSTVVWRYVGRRFLKGPSVTQRIRGPGRAGDWKPVPLPLPPKPEVGDQMGDLLGAALSCIQSQ